MRGSDDGIVVELVVGAPLVGLVELALTITESEDIAVRLFVAVGLIVCGAVVEGSLLVGRLVGGSVTELEGAVTDADALEGGSLAEDSLAVLLAVPLVALFVGAVPETVALLSVLVGTVLVLVGLVLVFVSVELLVPVLVFVGPVVPVLVFVSVGIVFVLVLVGPWVFVSVGPCVLVSVIPVVPVLVFVGPAVFVSVGLALLVPVGLAVLVPVGPPVFVSVGPVLAVLVGVSVTEGGVTILVSPVAVGTLNVPSVFDGISVVTGGGVTIDCVSVFDGSKSLVKEFTIPVVVGASVVPAVAGPLTPSVEAGVVGAG